MSVIAIARWVTLAVAAFGFAAEFASTAEPPEASRPPAELAGFFAPPEKYRSEFGSFRSKNPQYRHGENVAALSPYEPRQASFIR